MKIEPTTMVPPSTAFMSAFCSELVMYRPRPGQANTTSTTTTPTTIHSPVRDGLGAVAATADEAGVDPSARWLLAEGADAAMKLGVNYPAGPFEFLARWRVGLGWSMAWTSDVKNRWAVEWLRWPQFSRFWTQLVREHMRQRRRETLDMTAEVLDGEVRVSRDSGDGRSLELYRVVPGEFR